jgi:uncharacterized protein YjbI with pentapeptide repeats
LRDAILIDADLFGAILIDAILIDADLSGVNLEVAMMPDNYKMAIL